MRRILAPIVIALTFTVMFSSTSYAGWTRVVSAGGNIIYVDFERIRKHDGFVYYWSLIDYLKPRLGDLSAKTYWQGDCKLFRYKRMTASYHTQPMGEGTPSSSGALKNQKWKYPPPDSAVEIMLKQVCSW